MTTRHIRPLCKVEKTNSMVTNNGPDMNEMIKTLLHNCLSGVC